MKCLHLIKDNLTCNTVTNLRLLANFTNLNKYLCKNRNRNQIRLQKNDAWQILKGDSKHTQIHTNLKLLSIYKYVNVIEFVCVYVCAIIWHCIIIIFIAIDFLFAGISIILYFLQNDEGDFCTTFGQTTRTTMLFAI